MFKRAIEPLILDAAGRYRAITLIGPRQSGKTTLARHRLFPSYEYLSLENPDVRRRAELDPRGLLAAIKSHAIIDEIQRAPDLLSYLQGILDDPADQRRFVLTGSDSLLISDRIAQSLAGRTRIFKVLPLTFAEVPTDRSLRSLDETIWKGFYPRLYDQDLAPADWYGDYFQTYVEKDVRSLTQVTNLTVFDRFVRVAAGRVGQLLNFSSMASDVGLSQPTMTRWLSLLEASFVVFSLAPHFRNFTKRLVKSPKLYFYDTGLLCWLLGIRTPEHLSSHPLRGQIFENLIIAEMMKRFAVLGQAAPLYFWRDQHGHEVDTVLDRSTHLECTEIKSSATFQPDFIKQLIWLNDLQGITGGTVVYGGEDAFNFQGVQVQSWRTGDFGIST